MIARVFMIGAGIGAIGLGFKGFTDEGLPLNSETNISGVAATVIGIGCITIGLALLVFGACPSAVIPMLLQEP